MRAVRCFIAIELEQRLALLLDDVSAALRDAAPEWTGEKWVARHNYHITLKFLGDLPQSVLPILAADLAATASGLNAFEMVAVGIAARPSALRCDLLWVSFADPESRYAALADRLESLAADYGVSPERRGHHPHATLARARKARAISQDALGAGMLVLEPPGPPMSVSRVSLLSSTLTRSGSVYERIAVAPLCTRASEHS